jgi:hypothetical protein
MKFGRSIAFLLATAPCVASAAAQAPPIDVVTSAHVVKDPPPQCRITADVRRAPTARRATAGVVLAGASLE